MYNNWIVSNLLSVFDQTGLLSQKVVKFISLIQTIMKIKYTWYYFVSIIKETGIMYSRPNKLL